MKRYFEGLRFGMLLQLAIGPMCLMVFNTAKNQGFLMAFTLVLAIALVDAFYIVLAALGASKLLEKESVKRTVRFIGAAVLILFGLNISLGVFGVSLIPGLSVQTTSSSIFVQGLILTLSNPLTIVFWGSVLTTRLLEDSMSRNELAVFSCGLVSATLFFMTAVAALGTVLSSFLPQRISDLLNLAVGAAIVFFGVRMLVRKN